MRRISRLAGLLAALAGASQTPAAELPLWELGAGIGAIDFPDYRGSDERQRYMLPVPYLVYRGDLIKADRESLRGQFFKNDRIDLHLSLNASVPVDSSDNGTRRGMPDLDPTLEVGPNLELKLFRSTARDLEVDLRLPARTVIATDFSHTRNVGWVFQPQLNVDLRNTWLGKDWNVGMAIGPLFGDKRYHNYFFGVAPAFATTQRPAYVAPSGYAGAQWIGALSRRFPDFWFGAFVRLDTLKGASFEASPLVRQKESFSAGFAITWVLSRSAKTVEAEP
jgi:outer membrane scaffolding protein for murein synthesis (MipA/OmpV family)